MGVVFAARFCAKAARLSFRRWKMPSRQPTGAVLNTKVRLTRAGALEPGQDLSVSEQPVLSRKPTMAKMLPILLEVGTPQMPSKVQ